MFYVALFLTIFLVSTMLYLYLMSFKHPEEIAGYFGTKNILFSRSILCISFFIFIGILLLFLKQLHIFQDATNTPISPFISQKKIYSPQIQQLLVETYPKSQNYYFLYTASDTSEATLELIAKNIRKDNCAVPCTINFYDAKLAFVLDRQRVAIVDPAKMEEWNKVHYTFVADHYLGYLNADMYPAFSYYPYKDAYYQKLQKNRR